MKCQITNTQQLVYGIKEDGVSLNDKYSTLSFVASIIPSTTFRKKNITPNHQMHPNSLLNDHSNQYSFDESTNTICLNMNQQSVTVNHTYTEKTKPSQWNPIIKLIWIVLIASINIVSVQAPQSAKPAATGQAKKQSKTARFFSRLMKPRKRATSVPPEFKVRQEGGRSHHQSMGDLDNQSGSGVSSGGASSSGGGMRQIFKRKKIQTKKASSMPNLSPQNQNGQRHFIPSNPFFDRLFHRKNKSGSGTDTEGESQSGAEKRSKKRLRLFGRKKDIPTENRNIDILTENRKTRQQQSEGSKRERSRTGRSRTRTGGKDKNESGRLSRGQSPSSSTNTNIVGGLANQSGGYQAPAFEMPAFPIPDKGEQQMQAKRQEQQPTGEQQHQGHHKQTTADVSSITPLKPVTPQPVQSIKPKTITYVLPPLPISSSSQLRPLPPIVRGAKPSTELKTTIVPKTQEQTQPTSSTTSSIYSRGASIYQQSPLTTLPRGGYIQCVTYQSLLQVLHSQKETASLPAAFNRPVRTRQRARSRKPSVVTNQGQPRTQTGGQGQNTKTSQQSKQSQKRGSNDDDRQPNSGSSDQKPSGSSGGSSGSSGGSGGADGGKGGAGDGKGGPRDGKGGAGDGKGGPGDRHNRKPSQPQQPIEQEEQEQQGQEQLEYDNLDTQGEQSDEQQPSRSVNPPIKPVVHVVKPKIVAVVQPKPVTVRQPQPVHVVQPPKLYRSIIKPQDIQTPTKVQPQPAQPQEPKKVDKDSSKKPRSRRRVRVIGMPAGESSIIYTPNQPIPRPLRWQSSGPYRLPSPQPSKSPPPPLTPTPIQQVKTPAQDDYQFPPPPPKVLLPHLPPMPTQQPPFFSQKIRAKPQLLPSPIPMMLKQASSELTAQKEQSTQAEMRKLLELYGDKNQQLYFKILPPGLRSKPQPKPSLLAKASQIQHRNSKYFDFKALQWAAEQKVKAPKQKLDLLRRQINQFQTKLQLITSKDFKYSFYKSDETKLNRYQFMYQIDDQQLAAENEIKTIWNSGRQESIQKSERMRMLMRFRTRTEDYVSKQLDYIADLGNNRNKEVARQALMKKNQVTPSAQYQSLIMQNTVTLPIPQDPIGKPIRSHFQWLSEDQWRQLQGQWNSRKQKIQQIKTKLSPLKDQVKVLNQTIEKQYQQATSAKNQLIRKYMQALKNYMIIRQKLFERSQNKEYAQSMANRYADIQLAIHGLNLTEMIVALRQLNGFDIFSKFPGPQLVPKASKASTTQGQAKASHDVGSDAVTSPPPEENQKAESQNPTGRQGRRKKRKDKKDKHEKRDSSTGRSGSLIKNLFSSRDGSIGRSGSLIRNMLGSRDSMGSTAGRQRKNSFGALGSMLGGSGVQDIFRSRSKSRVRHEQLLDPKEFQQTAESQKWSDGKKNGIMNKHGYYDLTWQQFLELTVKSKASKGRPQALQMPRIIIQGPQPDKTKQLSQKERQLISQLYNQDVSDDENGDDQD